MLAQPKEFYNTHAHSLPDIQVGSKIALQNQQTKLWDIYKIVVSIGSNRRYFFKTQSGRILVRNRCLIPIAGTFSRYKVEESLSVIAASSDAVHQLHFNHPPCHMIEKQRLHMPPHQHLQDSLQLKYNALRDPADHLQDLLKIPAGPNDISIGAPLWHQCLGGSIGTVNCNTCFTCIHTCNIK